MTDFRIIDEDRQTCKVCGRVDYMNFEVSDEIWEKIVPGKYHLLVVCLACFDRFATEKKIDYSKDIKNILFVGNTWNVQLIPYIEPSKDNKLDRDKVNRILKGRGFYKDVREQITTDILLALTPQITEEDIVEVLNKENIDDGTDENDCPVKWAIVGGITDYDVISTLPEKEDKRIETYINNIAKAIIKRMGGVMEDQDRDAIISVIWIGKNYGK